jgi:hypothetical protein
LSHASLRAGQYRRNRQDLQLDQAERTGLRGCRFAERKGRREQSLRLGRPRAQCSDHPEHGIRRRTGGGPLVTLAADRFKNQRSSLSFMSEAEFELQFLSADQFEIKTKDGVTTRYRRAVGYTPTADDLKAFAGRYYSGELMSVFEATPGKDGLMVRANDAPRALLEFKPVARDTFQIGGLLLRFTRDKAGKVVGLQYSNPLLRNVKFTRLGDR